MAKFGFSPSAWTKAVRRLKLVHAHVRPDRCEHRGWPVRYDWDVVQRYHDEGHTRAETTRHFGFSTGAWDDAVARGVLIDGVGYSRSSKCPRLRAGARQATLARCWYTSKSVPDLWPDRMEGPTDVQFMIHHRNGVRDDHRLENLMMLAQLPQPNGVLRSKKQEVEAVDVIYITLNVIPG